MLLQTIRPINKTNIKFSFLFYMLISKFLPILISDVQRNIGIYFVDLYTFETLSLSFAHIHLHTHTNFNFIVTTANRVYVFQNTHTVPFFQFPLPILATFFFFEMKRKNIVYCRVTANFSTPYLIIILICNICKDSRYLLTFLLFYHYLYKI